MTARGAAAEGELPGDRENWPEAARVVFEERAALIEDGTGRSRAEAERNADHVTRRWWTREGSQHGAGPTPGSTARRSTP